MFIKTVKIGKRILFGAIAVTAAALGVLIAAAIVPRGAALISAPAVTDNAGRIAFLSGFGWEVEPEPCGIVEITIPAELDETYVRYNELQKTQGYDLTRFCGKTARRYTYRLLNYPSQDTDVRVSIIICGGEVIAGDISSTALDGFMHGLAYTAGD